MDMFTLWVFLYSMVSTIVMMTFYIERNWVIYSIRVLPFLLLWWFIFFSESYLKSYKSLYSEIYEKGNLKELSVKIKESKEYHEYKFQRDWEEKESNGN